MSTDNKLSLLVKSQLPEYIRDNYETFTAFLKAYYEFLEQDSEAHNLLVNSVNYKDVDETLDLFVSYFLKQFVYGIPLTVFDENNTESKRFLVKYISSLYRAKGSPNALKFLFRLAFDEEIDVIFPSDYLLRPSDGRWAKTVTIRASVSPSNTNILALEGMEFYGSESGIYSGIDHFITQPDNTHLLYLNDTDFIFNDYQFNLGEALYFTDANINANVSISVLNTLVSIDIIDGGLGYTANDVITITPSGPMAGISAVNESGKITSVYLSESSCNLASNTTISLPAPSDTRSATYELKSNVVTICLNSGIKHGLNIEDSVNLVILDGGLTTNNYIVSSLVNKKIFRVQKTAANTSGNLTLTYLNNANLQANINTVVRNPGGYGITVEGQLDTTTLLQDSYKWQQYSYIIRSSLDIDTWLDLVKKTLHPAGMEIFGEVTLYSDSSSSDSSVYVGPVEVPAGALDRTAYDAIIGLILELISDTPISVAGGAPDAYYIIEMHEEPWMLDSHSRVSAGATLEVLETFKFEYGNAFPINIIDDYLVNGINPLVPTNFQPPSHVESPYRDLANANVIYSQRINT